MFDTIADKNIVQKSLQGRAFLWTPWHVNAFTLQDLMCEMEGGAGCYLYPCGAAAVTNAILSFVETGDHVLMTGAAYEPTQDFCNVILKKCTLIRPIMIP